MKHQVIILPSAERDLDQILTWLYRRSQQGAKTWLDCWDETVLSLADNPERFSLAPESKNHPVEILQVLFRTRKGNPYRALFAIQNNKVFVIHIRGMGQRLIEKISFPSLE